MNKVSMMMTVKEAAAQLRVGRQKIRTGIISGTLPIGWAIFEEKRNCYSYIIPRERFEACITGADLRPVIPSESGFNSEAGNANHSTA